jgi:diacylglycerol kinase family enzyme
MVDLSDGYFELLLITAPKDIVQLNTITKALLEQNYDTPLVKVYKVKNVKIECEDAPNWSLDGEYEQGREVCEFSVLPAALHMKY